MNNNYNKKLYNKNSSFNYGSGNYRNKSQPPVACYPVTLGFNDGGNVLKSTDYKAIVEENKQVAFKTNYLKKYTTAVNYNKSLNYKTKPNFKENISLKSDLPISLEKNVFYTENVQNDFEKKDEITRSQLSIKSKCEKSNIDCSEFPAIDDLMLQKDEKLSEFNKVDANVQNILNDNKQNYISDSDNTFPFPADIRHIYMEMYQKYQIYEKKY